MCRFLVVYSEKAISMRPILVDFAKMCEVSRTHDGDRQKDGWGVSWLNSKGEWKIKKSLKPIWRDRKLFIDIPKTKLLVVHARAASYEKTIGDISFNQPFVGKKYVYVFNGHLRGVQLKTKVAGGIGSQKAWSLIESSMKKNSAKAALSEVYKLIKSNTKELLGLDIALVSKKTMVIVSDTNINKDDYYRLWEAEKNGITIVCSEKISGFKFSKLPKGGVLEYNFI